MSWTASDRYPSSDKTRTLAQRYLMQSFISIALSNLSNAGRWRVGLQLLHGVEPSIPPLCTCPMMRPFWVLVGCTLS